MAGGSLKKRSHPVGYGQEKLLRKAVWGQLTALSGVIKKINSRVMIQISTINNVNIVSVIENGQTLIPIKPICEAIGISHQKQMEKLKADPILSSTITLQVTLGADNKQREMLCLPLKFVYGWLFSINPQNVKPAAKENVIKYKLECYEVLYDHFFGGLKKQIEIDKQEIEAMRRVNELVERKNAVNEELKAEKKKLELIRQKKIEESVWPSLF